MSANQHGATVPGKVNLIQLTVLFIGSVALSMGQAVCFNRAMGTATEADGNRDRQVSLPDNTNNMNFAGVVSRAYPADSSGQQYIVINLPGSVCYVLANAAQTIGQNSLMAFQFKNANAADADAGKWRSDYAACFNGAGCGTARILQTRADAGLVLAELQTGQQNGGIEFFTAGASLIIQPTGVSVITRDGTTNRSLTALVNGTYIGQRKLIRVIGATAATVTFPLAAAKGSRQGTGASAGEQQHNVEFTNIVVPVAATTAECSTLLEWTGLYWRVIYTNLLAAAFT